MPNNYENTEHFRMFINFYRNGAHFESKANFTYVFPQERTVGPGQYVVVTVKVHAGTQLGDTLAHLTLQTDFEQVQIPAHMRVEHGSLQVTPDPVVFNDCFPVSEDLLELILG